MQILRNSPETSSYMKECQTHFAVCKKLYRNVIVQKVMWNFCIHKTCNNKKNQFNLIKCKLLKFIKNNSTLADVDIRNESITLLGNSNDSDDIVHGDETFDMSDNWQYW